MRPAERLKDWIDSLGVAWGDRLRGWMASWAKRGILEFFEDMEPEGKEQAKSIMAKIKANPATPPQVKEAVEGFETGGPGPLMILAIVMIVATVIQAVQAIWIPAQKEMSYVEEKVAQTFRLDPISVITAWWRDPVKYADLFNDLKDQGWSDTRIEALKFFTKFYPSPGDLVHWQAREVFEPKMVDKYGLKDELGELKRDAFYKAGMTNDQIDNYWMAHWEHPELRTIIEMLRRTDFTEDDMRAWFRLVEIPPYWRDKLIEISYEVPTRVDVRRFWDMRTIDEARLREIYSWQGYHGKDLDDYVLWTKVYTAFPDLIARWKNGWITLDDVKRELTGYGMPEARVSELIETKIESTGAERTTNERDLTKTEIYKGVKKELITWGEGIELLMDLGYDEDEADYILSVNVAVEAGSPETYPEFKDLTTKWRKSTRMAAKPVDEQLKQAAAEVVKLTRDLKALQERVKEEERSLVSGEVLPPEATKKVDELRVSLHRAESALAAARSDYDRLVAEWRHKA